MAKKPSGAGRPKLIGTEVFGVQSKKSGGGAPSTPSPDQAAQQLLAQRVLARRRLLYFTRTTYPNYKPGWVHEDICARLERFSRQVAEQKSPRLMLLCPPRHGKSVKNQELTLTANRGWVEHGRLQPGDLVFGPDGKPAAVLAVGPEHPVDCEVEFSDGSVIQCHENHEWTVYDRARRIWRTLETNALEQYQLRSGKDARCRFQVHNLKPLCFPEAPLPIDPYVLGAWLGDGSSDRAQITVDRSDRAVLDRVASVYGTPKVRRDPRDNCLRAVFAALHAPLEFAGVLRNKHIPTEYLQSSIEQREALLAGLIDTDGHLEQRTGRVRIATVSERLRDDIVTLLRSLGLRPYVYAAPPTLSTSGIQGRQAVYYVGFQPERAIPCVLPRKRYQRLLPRRPRIGIRAVRRVPPVLGRCIQVDRPDGLYLVGKTLIPTHNSELASIRFPAWHLGQYPEHEIINVGYNLDLPMRFSRKVRELARDSVYQRIFPDAVIDPDSQSVEAWNMTRGGGFTAAGVGGGITGKGAHVLIIDDPLKNQEEADSIDRRDLLEAWYQSTAYTRLAPGGGVLLIETWWNDDDLAGRLQRHMEAAPDADQFEIVKYPALAEHYEWRHRKTLHIVRTAEPVLSDADLIGEARRAERFGHEVDGGFRPEDFELLRSPGDPLHVDRYPAEALRRIKATIDPRIWSALYQQNPVPDEGMYFRKEYFRYVRALPDMHGGRIFTAWDFAIGEKQSNDFTVGATILQDYTDTIYVLDIHRMKGDAGAIVDAILNTARRWSSVPGTDYLLGFEDGQIFKSIEVFLKQRMAEQSFYPPYETMKPLTDKMARARPLQGRFQHGRVFFPEDASWRAQAEHELLRFPGGAHDDVVDALAWATRLSMGKAPPRRQGAVRLPSWKDRLNELLGERGGSHMAS